MPITPDTKDWTWVLERVCPECGFDVRSFPREQVGSLIRDNAARWDALLAHPDVRQRPSDDRWSGLEYACHVRDVFRLYDSRLQMMLDQDDPRYPNWDQDASAVEGRYAEQDPARVVAELQEAAEAIARRFERVTGEQWDRTGTRSDGARFTVESFARYLIHDPVHHVDDVQKGYAHIDERS
ncbi:MAG: DinB family protein [Actinomycetota bacterium]